MPQSDLELFLADRRDTPRVPLALDTMIRFSHGPFQPYRTRDISLDGVFIEVGPHTFTLKDKLELALKIPVRGTPQVYHFQGHVSRVEQFGVGMVFDHTKTNSYAALMELLFTHQPTESY